ASDPTVGKTLSIVDFVREMHRASNGGDPARATIPPSPELISQYLFLYSVAGDPEDLNSQIDPDHRSAAIRIFLRNDSTEYAEEIIARVQRYVTDRFPRDYTVQYSGITASTAALTEVMVRGKLLNMLQVAGIIVLVAGIVLRSVLGGLLVAAPLAMAVLV